jgi:lysozyme family protein
MATIQEVITEKIAFPLAKADKNFLEELQQKLKDLNYYFDAVDGAYGPNTAEAWKQFKSDHCQGSFDICGPGSLKLLQQAKARVVSPLAAGYTNLWNSCLVKLDKIDDCDWVISRKFVPNIGKYQAVEKATMVPWYVVAVLHARESDCDFNCHLHNGDPLSARTTHVPAGRPAWGKPPYQWYESAIDALQENGIANNRNWSIANTLEKIEKYNGTGYFHKEVNSPYVWAGTNQYSCGKYVADGRYSSTAVDNQLGCAALLKRLEAKGLAKL